MREKRAKSWRVQESIDMRVEKKVLKRVGEAIVEVSEEKPGKERRSMTGCRNMLSAVHGNSQHSFSFAGSQRLGSDTAELGEHVLLLILFEFNCVIRQLRADKARTHL